MLSGQRPKECVYCWNIEDSSKELYSDRIYKSNEDWALSDLNKVIENPLAKDFQPSYVEVSFSNTCNFRCSYCSPQFSSKWFQEAKSYGKFPTSHGYNDIETANFKNNLMPIQNEDTNPYVAAFWKWWPTLYPNLKVFRITGGEPLLSPNTFKILSFIKEHPNSNLHLGVNSNLGVPRHLIEKFCSSIREILNAKSIKKMNIYTSVDTHGQQAEYIRNGLSYKEFIENINYLRTELPEVQITIMCTFNALSISRFEYLLEDVAQIRAKFYEKFRIKMIPLYMDISYLRHPAFLAVQILPKDLLARFELVISKMKSLSAQNLGWHVGYHESEIAKLIRIYDWAQVPIDPAELKQQRHDFYKFITEHDLRRGTNFNQTFPELSDFLRQCSGV